MFYRTRAKNLSGGLRLTLGIVLLAASGLAVATVRFANTDPLSAASEAAPARSSYSPDQLTWKFIGPRPIKGEDANFGDVHLGSTFDVTGRVTAIATTSTNPNLVVVGLAGGGVWLSTDDAVTFTPVFDAQRTQMIGAIAIDSKTKPPTIYVGTGEANESDDSYYGQGLFKSTNLGSSWTAVAPGTFDHVGIARIAINNAAEPPTLFLATSAFVRAPNRSDAQTDVVDSSKDGLWRSTDGGVKWMQYKRSNAGSVFGCFLDSSTCPATDVAVDQSFPRNVYVAIENDGVFRSTNGGDSFSLAGIPGTGPTSSNIGRLTLAVQSGSKASNGKVFAMVGGGAGPIDAYFGFFASTDSGLTWAQRNVPCDNVEGSGVVIDGTSDGKHSSGCGGFPATFSQEIYDQTLGLLGSTLFFGGVGLYASSDGGTAWSFLPSSGGIHADMHALAPDQAHAGNVFVGSDGGLYRVNLNTLPPNIMALNSIISGSQFQGIGPHPTKNNLVLGGFQDNGTNLWDGSSLAWSQKDGGNGGDGGLTSFDRKDPSFAYHTYATARSGPVIARSTDGGMTWQSATPTINLQTVFGSDSTFDYPPFAVDPGTAHRVFLAGHKVYVSTDGMLTWQPQETTDLSDGCGFRLCAIADIEFAPSDPTRAYTVGAKATNRFGRGNFTVFTTANANVNSGGTWTNITGTLPATATSANTIAVDPHNAGNVYLGLSGFTASTGAGHIFHSTNFGATWSRADGSGGASPLPDIPVTKLLVDKRDPTGKTVLAGTDIGVFRTTDAGSTWSAFNLGVIPESPVFDLQQNNNGVIFAATHGRGAFMLGAAVAMATPTPRPTHKPTPSPTRKPTPTATRAVTRMPT